MNPLPSASGVAGLPYAAKRLNVPLPAARKGDLSPKIESPSKPLASDSCTINASQSTATSSPRPLHQVA